MVGTPIVGSETAALAAGAQHRHADRDSPDGKISSRRFLALDALRGFAALAVVFYHVQGALDRAPQSWMPGIVRGFFHAGHFGVDVFFVLSGFVIAYSVRDGAWTPAYLGRFVFKRSLRLDPPYWTAIALEIGLILVGLAVVPSLATPVPTRAQILAHLVYLQDVLGYGEIMPNFWTLCYEVQFYLTLVGMLVMGQTLKRRFGARVSASVVGTALVALFLASLAVHHGWISGVPRGLALDRWSEFFTGVLAWWVVSGTISLPVLVVAWLTSILVATRPDAPIEITIVLLVSTICMLSAVRPAFDRVFGSRPIQFLGAISYSLYLYHPSVGWRVVTFAQRLAGPSLPPVIGVITWFGAVGSAILIAIVGWRFVERPSQALGRRITLPRRQPSAGTGPSKPVQADPA